jgi:uncharacterized protein (DUF1330 family)
MATKFRGLTMALGAVPLCITLALSAPGRAADAKGYVIQEILVTDAAKYKDYAAQATATVAAYEGKFIIRNDSVDVISGAAPAGRVVVLEFPSLAKAKAWHDSPEYQKVLPIRNASSTSRVFIVEGAP